VLQSELRVLELRRARLQAQIPSEFLSSYDDLVRSQRKPAIVTLSAGFCGGCKARIGTELYGRLQGGEETLRCPRCGRFLLLPSWERHV
jgi:predicted  nucleic acid-binding Zn-ribbon protein